MSRFSKHVMRIKANLTPGAGAQKARLLALRRTGDQHETSLETRPSELIFDRSDWVSIWMDPRQCVISDCGTLTATRAITPQGRLLWMVRKSGLQRAYHSRETRADQALQDARIAWRRRKEQSNLKGEVRRIVRDLGTFRVRYSILIDDAYQSPLCDEGVDGFLRSLGIAGFRRYPGWLIAWLFRFDRQVGFVLYEAHKRQNGMVQDRTIQADS